MYHLLSTIGDLLSRRTPAVVLRRAGALELQIIELGKRVAAYADWSALLRSRLAELVGAAKSDEG